MLDLFSTSHPVLLVSLVVFAFLPFFANTAFWTIALKELGEEITWKQVNEAAFKTTLTRYLPGGIWLFASRSLALKNEGVATHSLIVLFGLENLLAASSYRCLMSFMIMMYFIFSNIVSYL